jgi:mono/diheme cytochrome c family protein
MKVLRSLANPCLWVWTLLGVGLIATKSTAADAYAETIRPLLAKHCLACHGEGAKAKRLRLDQLTPDFVGDKGEHWADVLEKVRSGDMPPSSKPRPTAAEKKLLQDWIQERLQAAGSAQQKAEGRVPLRRLNRDEYQNTVRELLAIDVDLKEMLPEENAVDGFDNNAEGLSVSTVLMQRYLEAAEAALDAAVVRGPRPELYKKRTTSFAYDRKPTDTANSAAAYRLGDDSVFFLDREIEHGFGGQDVLPSLPKDFPLALKVGGRYRFTMSGYGYQTKTPVTLGVYTRNRSIPGGRPILVGHFDFKPGEPQIVEFIQRLNPNEVISMASEGLGGEIVSMWIKNRKFPTGQECPTPGIALQWIEMEGPLYDTWSPESQRRIFGDLPVVAVEKKDKGKKTTTYTVESTKPAEDGERLLRQFATRAFRRPATDAELRPILDLFRARLKGGVCFQDAVLLGCKTVLCSPNFLYFREEPGKLNDYALASRLSYFLWSSLPDQELLDLAAKTQLSEPATLRKQTERLLQDPKAKAFTENFVGQWLGLRKIECTLPDERLYPEFDELLQHSMPKETTLFFDEILKNDLSVLNFVDSDFSMLNGRLARHYGIPGVEGMDFRKVKLPADSDRGGVLGHASILRLTANGTTTSPVVRGAWVLRNILGRPPSPPPPDVPAVEPDLKGATTIRQLLDKHRVKGCAECHTKIDPLGFALEEFDVIGGRRDFYRSAGGKDPQVNVEVRGRKVNYRKGPRVDATGEMADGKKYASLAEFKRLLLEDREQIARCLAEKLLTYGTGKGVRAGDAVVIDAILTRTREKNYGLRSLVHEVVQSTAFLDK